MAYLDVSAAIKRKQKGAKTFKERPSVVGAMQCGFCSKFMLSPQLLLEHRDTHPSQLLDHLWLGNEMNASEKETLQELNVTRILNAADDAKIFHEKDFEYKHLQLKDISSQQLRTFFDETFKFLDEAKAKNESVLVHCVQGVSRSASLCIAYIMYTNKWSRDVALEYVKDRRRLVQPNPGFMSQLRDYEDELKQSFGTLQRVLPGQPSTPRNSDIANELKSPRSSPPSLDTVSERPITPRAANGAEHKQNGVAESRKSEPLQAPSQKLPWALSAVALFFAIMYAARTAADAPIGGNDGLLLSVLRRLGQILKSRIG
jgi:protein-tyrosine phosphatase